MQKSRFSARLRPFAATVCMIASLVAGCLGNTLDGKQATATGSGAADGTDDGAASDTAALDGDPNLANAPFSPLPLAAQVSKVKAMLHGDVVTEADLAQAQNEGMAALIRSWQQTPQYAAHMVQFLSVALQQSQVTAENASSREKGYQFTRGTAGTPQYKFLLQNIRESMARTVLALDAQGQPFSTTMTTHSFMMTPPLAAFYIIDDGITVADDGNVTSTSVDYSTRVGQNSLGFCTAYPNSAYTQWSLVNIRPPNAGESTSALLTPSAPMPTQLVLQTPRLGFMTTPAFFNQWRSNSGNSSRVQINQALIVALGAQFDGSQYVAPLSTAAMDAAHVQPNTPCYSCHIDMDPMRQLYRRYWTFFGDLQTDATQRALPSQFVWGGISQATNKADDLGTQLANHPMMPLAWAQKVCAFANSAPCETSDPELIRIADVFAKNQSFSELVRNVFSSPLTTYARATETTVQNGVTFSVAKVDQLCPLLSQRLGIDDVCGLDPQANPQGDLLVVQTITSIFPANAFARGTVNTGQANDPTLFLRSGAENVCLRLANLVVDKQAAYTSGNPNQSIGNLVHGLMGIQPADDTEPTQLLQAHFTAATAAGLSAADALRSTFAVACLSPSVMGIGQ